jgi:hypothetical protein
VVRVLGAIMTAIRSRLSRAPSRPVKEVIEIEQRDEATLSREIGDYVAADRCKQQYLQVLKAIADASAEPIDG